MTSVSIARALPPTIGRVRGLRPQADTVLAVASGLAAVLQAVSWAQGTPGSGASTVFMLALATAFVVATVLRQGGRAGPGAVLTSAALLVATVVARVIYPPSAVLLVIPIIAFIVALPCARGMRLGVLGMGAIAASVVAGLPSHFAAASPPDQLVIAASVALAPGVVMAIAWRSHRSALEAAREADDVRNRLASLVEHAADAITTRDCEGRILTWNPGAERLYGWRAEEVIGRSIRFLVPPEERESFQGLHEQVMAGHRVGPFEVARPTRDGRTVTVSIINSPIRDADGTVVGVASIARDVTQQRRLEARLERWRADRQVAIEALEGLQAGPTSDATAAAVCAEVARAGFRDVAIVAWGPTGESLDVLCTHGGDAWTGWAAGDHLARLRRLRSRSSAGVWATDLAVPLPAEVDAVAYAPIVHTGRELGLLLVADPAMPAEDLRERLPALVEFGAVAAPLIGPALVAGHERTRTRARIRAVIDTTAFQPVFQPIVRMDAGQVVGYEALTRFADGTRPDRMFADARAVGLGPELEAATLRAALEAAGPLPANRFLDLNVSPELILAEEPLRTMLEAQGFGTVLEITEHSEVPDYEAFRAALRRLPGARLGVDDAGAGFSSLRHIIELRPDLIKLDRALTSGVDRDPVRQALVAGMVHFAERIGADLVAEGVETVGERDALLAAGVRQGQGFLLGRPEAIGAAGWQERVEPAAPRQIAAPLGTMTGIAAAP